VEFDFDTLSNTSVEVSGDSKTLYTGTTGSADHMVTVIDDIEFVLVDESVDVSASESVNRIARKVQNEPNDVRGVSRGNHELAVKTCKTDRVTDTLILTNTLSYS
jgi:hypothetical protein